MSILYTLKINPDVVTTKDEIKLITNLKKKGEINEKDSVNIVIDRSIKDYELNELSY